MLSSSYAVLHTSDSYEKVSNEMDWFLDQSMQYNGNKKKKTKY